MLRMRTDKDTLLFYLIKYDGEREGLIVYVDPEKGVMTAKF